MENLCEDQRRQEQNNGVFTCWSGRQVQIAGVKLALFPDAEASVKLKIRRLYSCMGRVYTTSYSYILVSIFTVERHCRKLQPLLLENMTDDIWLYVQCDKCQRMNTVLTCMTPT